jgi:ELWxxDGT repeat protein
LYAKGEAFALRHTLTLAAVAAILRLFAASPAVAEQATLVFDLAPDGATGVPNLEAAVFEGQLYFSGKIDNGTLDLWVHDGANAPALVPGGTDLAPEELTVWQGAIYFRAGPSTDREIWRFDGVTAPVEILDLLPTGSGFPEGLTAFGDELCFSANAGSAIGTELVCWDGATAPDVYDLRTGSSSSNPENLTVIDDRLYFDAYVDGIGSEPHVRLASSAPTLVGDVNPGTSSSNPDSFVELGSNLYFRASDGDGQGRVWVDDGIVPPTLVSATFDVEGGLSSFGGRLLADGYEEEEGGTQQMHVLREGGLARAPWPGGSIFSAHGFLLHEGALYFRSAPSSSAGDLFRYCGGGNVERVTDQFIDASSVVNPPIEFQGQLYFVADVSAFGRELWRVDPWTVVFCDGFEDEDTAAWP